MRYFSKAATLRTATGLLIAAFAISSSAFADRDHGHEHDRAQQRVYDQRYHHNHYYPSRGSEFRVLPRAAVTVRFGGNPYYFSDGIWYRPHGPRFVVVAPPFGLFVRALPPFYSTVWVSGVPYYYANDTYYTWAADRNGYVVTRPPEDADVAVQAPTAQSSSLDQQIFMYPKKGQSEQQQATDRYECHSWAVSQTHYDPSQANVGDSTEKRTAYSRAMTACLEGRDYSVK